MGEAWAPHALRAIPPKASIGGGAVAQSDLERTSVDRGGRPPGEIRLALLQAAREYYLLRLSAPLEAEDGSLLVGALGDELAQRALVGREAARTALKNLVRGPTAELRIVGRWRPHWSVRAFAVYQPVERQPRAWGTSTPAVQALAGAVKAWVAPGAESGDQAA